MPIKSIDQIKRLPRLGVIRLGIKETSQKGIEYPKAVDYFVCPDEVKKVFGEDPRDLPIVLPAENIDDIFPRWYKSYGKTKGLKRKCDGEMVTVFNDDGSSQTKTCDCSEKEHHMVGTLNFIVPRVSFSGVYQINTSSYNSIINIKNCLEYIKKLFGRVSGIPLHLIVQPYEAHPVVEKKKIAKTVYLLRLEFLNEELMEYAQNPKGYFLAQILPGGLQLEAEPETSTLPSPESQEKVVLPESDERPDDLFPEEEAQEPDNDNETERTEQQNPPSNDTPLKIEIVRLMQGLGVSVKNLESKECCEQFVKQRTSLDLIPQNYQEIVSRLSILTQTQETRESRSQPTLPRLKGLKSTVGQRKVSPKYD